MENCDVISFANPDELARAAAKAWLEEIEAAYRVTETHCIALSGGRITETFFQAVVEASGKHGSLFREGHFFFADERCVPPDSLDSNFHLATERLFKPLQIAPEKTHRLRGEIEPTAAVSEANADIFKTISARKNGLPVLDLIFLGVGPDGHVASLFPNASLDVIGCQAPFLCIDNSPKPPPKRISLSYAAIAAAKEVWVLVSGAGKEKALRESLAPEGQTPLARVIQSRSMTKIFTDVGVKV